MESAARVLVRTRARNCCEYCLLPQDGCSLTHHIEHIISRQHGGSDDHGNLALACHRCNRSKGPNLTGIDPSTAEIVPLFNPIQSETRPLARSFSFPRTGYRGYYGGWAHYCQSALD